MIIFETGRLIVREYEEDDRDHFFLLNGDEEVMRYIRPAKSRKEADRFFDETLAGYHTTPLIGRWAVNEKASKNFVGSFAILPIPKQTELLQLGYAILKDHWGKGFATELTVAGLHHAFNIIKLHEIFGLTQKDNLISQKVLLKAGFKRQKETKEEEKTVCWFLYKKQDWSPDQ